MEHGEQPNSGGAGLFRVLLYYKYVSIPDPEGCVRAHRAWCEELALRGRVLIGREGLNGTVAGPVEATDRYRERVQSDPLTAGIEFKEDICDDYVFPKLAVKLRPEVVSLGLSPEEDIDPNAITGERLSPVEFRETMRQDGVVLLDARNGYESALGRFEGAICPDVENFRDLPEWIREHAGELEGRKILTYCTGGIRCEKLSGYLRKQGFEEIYQLDGGIIKYGQDAEVRGDGFEGLCYVFDQRVGVEANFTPSRKIISRCSRCGEPSPRYRNCAWPECNRQIFLCQACEESGGRLCSETCRNSLHGAGSH